MCHAIMEIHPTLQEISIMPKLVCLTSRILVENHIEKQFVNTRYLTPLHQRDLNTLMLTLNTPDPEAIFDLCDAFLVTGGTDLNPATYGEENHGLSKDVHERLDQLDKQVIDYAKSHHKPLLGICRGHQSLNVFMGGSLIQDLNSQGLKHDHLPDGHMLKTTAHPRLTLHPVIQTNSYHHQAVKRLAKGFDVVATHEDGTIEAMIHSTLPMIGVQWHPEADPESSVSDVIFDTFHHMILS